MRVAQKDEMVKPIVQALKPIAEFLNGVGAKTTPSEWRGFLQTYLKTRMEDGLIGLMVWVGPGRFKATITLRQAKEVRQCIVSDLRYLDFDREHRTTTEAPFGPLTLRLSEVFTAGSWHCAALGTQKAEPGQAILTLKRQNGEKERWAATFLPFREVRTLKEKFYAILGRTLLTGDLTRLKICRQCGKYFVALKDRKRDFCEGATCKDQYHSDQRSKSGYYDYRRRKLKHAGA